MTTRIISITDLRRDTSRIMQALREDVDVVYITQRGHAAAVLLDFDQYQALLAQLADFSDRAALEEVESERARSYDDFLAEMDAPKRA